MVATHASPALCETLPESLHTVLAANDLIVFGDAKHGASERLQFFSSDSFFAAMHRSGVRHIAIEMPRVLGRQAMSVESDDDVETFASDVIRSGRWHFTDPENPGVDSYSTQYLVASSLGRQVLLAKKYGIRPIFYDFNNPLGNFRTHNDPVYRCLANLSTIAWVKYALNDQVSKETRDAAIMRERFSHDDEMAEYIEHEMADDVAGKLVVIAGYAHAVMPGGLAERLEARLRRQAMIMAVFKDEQENGNFHDFLWQQAALIQINLTRAPHRHYLIDKDAVRQEERPGRFAAIDGTNRRIMPSLCFQWAQLN